MVMRISSLGQILTQCCFFLAVVLFCASTPALWAQTPHEKIIFSIPSRSIAAIDLYVAKERGFFRDEGLDVDIVQIRGNVAVAAALSGQVHASNGVGTVIRALERSELPLKILTVSLKRNLFWLVARPEIKSIANLKGKVLGTTTLGGAQHTAAARLLRERKDLVRHILRARAKGGHYFLRNERGTSEILAKYQRVELPVAIESYRLSKPAFTTQGIPTENEIEEFLKADADLLKLPKPV